ncbi:ankyrin [Lepidopterella palustris CBS 459.81]|uniref:Ankyrin n=1 Tax=Lepidopterella palustris CBS 459.81 TaxID=1314670 RepID=A0A8E2DYC7_9PEZI|nr:ankyrin [Lepidopterella palustris CBS 459.81]
MRFVLNGDLLELKNLIISGKASIFDTAPDGWSLLHTSAYHSQFEVTRFLLQCGADEDVPEVKSRKPSHFAKFKALSYKASREQTHLAKAFSNHDDFREDFELSPILSSTLGEYASSDSERPSLQRIIWFATLLCVNSPNVEWYSCKIKYRDRSPLFLELIHIFEVGYKKQESPLKTFYILLEQPDSIQFWSPVLWAAFMGKEGQLKTLLDSGANPFYITPSGRNLYHHAAESGNNAVVQYVLRQGYHNPPGGMDINLADYWLETPLHLATAHSEDMITSYLQHGANPLAKQMDGELPLHYIARHNDGNRLNCLNASLAIFPPHSPAINAQNNIGWTPLFQVLDSPPCVGKLLQWGANPHVADEKGKNVLHHACELHYASSLSVLLDYVNEETVNAKDDEGNTPLFVAFENSSFECARIILRRCAVWDTRDGQGRSVIQLATDAGDDICLRLVLSIAGIHKGETIKLNRKGKTKVALF